MRNLQFILIAFTLLAAWLGFVEARQNYSIFESAMMTTPLLGMVIALIAHVLLVRKANGDRD